MSEQMGEGLDLLILGGLFVLDHIVILPELPDPGEAVLFHGLSHDLSETYFGGCTINVAATAAALGLRVGLACVTGKDHESSGYQAHLSELGIRTDWLIHSANEDIARCYLFYNPDGVKLSFMDSLDPQETYNLAISQEELENTRYLVLVGGEKDDPAADAMLKIAERAVNAGTLVALTWAGGKGEIEKRYFDYADVILCNQYEARRICQAFELGSLDLIQSLGVDVFIVTRGNEGSTVYSSGKQVKVPAITTPCTIDPTGAGDAYAGGVLTALVWGYAPHIATRVGSVVASFVVRKKGCQTNLPSRKLMASCYEDVFRESLPRIDHAASSMP